jgi:hypothetical protein
LTDIFGRGRSGVLHTVQQAIENQHLDLRKTKKSRLRDAI